MSELTIELMEYYQRDLRDGDTGEGRKALSRIGITSPTVVDRFDLGYCSGRGSAAMNDTQRQQLIALGLVHRRPQAEVMKGCVVLPVYNERGGLVDLCGLRPWQSGLRYIHWQPTARGLIGAQAMNAIEAEGEAILCDTPFHALHAVQHGYENVLAIRHVDELTGHLDCFERIGLRRVYLVSRQQRRLIAPQLTQRGIEVVTVTTPGSQSVVPRSRYEDAMGQTRVSAGSPNRPRRPDAAQEAAPPTYVKLVSRSEARLMFEADSVRYTIDSTALTGLAMRVQVRAECSERTCIDKVDLGSAAARRKTARHLAAGIGLMVADVEDHLGRIASKLDELILEAAQQHAGTPHSEDPLTTTERDTAMSILTERNVLTYLADALESVFGYVGEDAAKRLALLVAASRLLPQPLGALFRGPAGSGKSALMRAVMQTLPAEGSLYFSRLTAQALYFLPQDQLSHRLLVCDEYEGLLDSEYALRSLMSSQMLSLAITVREGGKVPVTRTVEVPATLAVMVSTTGAINAENLSRFIEIGLDTSAEQTHRIMQAAATPAPAPGSNQRVREVRGVNGVLRPCSVFIPYADQLAGQGGAVSVLARRRFGHIIGLIAAHAALHQYQRPVLNSDDDRPPMIEATPNDYAVVYPLLSKIIEHGEEDVSPPAMSLLRVVQGQSLSRLTRQQVMDTMNWSYSRAYRVLKELTHLDLLRPDTTTNGVLRTYEVSSFHLIEDGASPFPQPDAIATESVQH